MRRQCWRARAAGLEQIQRLVDLRRQRITFEAETRQQKSQVAALDVEQFEQQMFDLDKVMAALQAALGGAFESATIVRVEASDQAGQFHVQVISS